MFKNLFNRKTKYEKFWLWFEGFESIMFKEFQENQFNQNMYGILNSHLQQVHPELAFEIGVKPEQIELVITANGIKKIFPEVQKLVDVSPLWDQWKITAFKPRIPGDDFSVNYGGQLLGYNDIYFQFDDSGDKLGIQLNIRNFEKSPPFINGTYCLLDALIGELDVTNQIGFIDWEVLDESNKDALLPFIKLREIVDQTKQ